MANLNKVTLIGRLGRDPERRFLKDGRVIAVLPLATSEYRTDEDGMKFEKTEWHRVVFYGALAETAAKYLKKGDQAYIEGKLKTARYTDRGGIARETVEIAGTFMQMLSNRPKTDEREAQAFSRTGARGRPSAARMPAGA